MIKTAITHKIYEFCIDVIFDNISINFFKEETIVPNVGDRFLEIKDIRFNEIYFKCEVIKPEELDFYDEMDYESEIKHILFAIKYSKLETILESIKPITLHGGTEHFFKEDIKNLRFKK